MKTLENTHTERQNCVVKSPPSNAFAGRYRRLCKTCQKAPLSLLTAPTSTADDEESSIRLFDEDGRLHTLRRNSEPHHHPHHHSPNAYLAHIDLPLTSPAFTAPAFARTPCSCASHLYLCHPCGRSLRASDDTYNHGWKWRTHYSAKLGGLGAGIGEGHEGVKCGRRALCLAVREVETEVECSAEEMRELQEELERVASESSAASGSGSGQGDVAGGEGRNWEGTSYLSQEIEGVGGGLKRKVRKLVKVGAVVKEYEDERRKANFIERERKGSVRSWCAWCERVIPGLKDGEAEGGMARRGSSISSSGSESGV
jgi:hypothetical protein